MRALILAAGRGSRLQALTENRPKALVPLKGRPLLDWQLFALRGAGIADIALVGGYCLDALTPYRLPRFKNQRWAETNMVRSLLCAQTWMVEEPVIVSYSDIVYDTATVKRLAATTDDLAITFDPHWLALWSARFDDPLSDAETFALDAAGYLDDIGGRPERLGDVRGQYMGLLKFTPAGWARITGLLHELPASRVDKLDMTSTLRMLLERGTRIKAVPAAGPWAEVDSESDLALYERADGPVKLPPTPVDGDAP
jgi:choline kinase